MNLLARIVLGWAVCSAVACGGGVTTDASDGGSDVTPFDTSDGATMDSGGVIDAADTVVVPDAPTCVATSTSDLPGVHIEIDATHCVFTLAQASAGIAIAYDVVVDADVQGVVPAAQDAGRCGAADGSGLIPFESLGGSGQNYCLCDTGLCPGPSSMPITLPAGRYHHTFMWDGTNWSGPSDTGNPHGPAFPPGSYRLRVSAVGTHASGGTTSNFLVEGTLPITLVP